MSDGPTIGDWTQYEWIPDNASSFPARIRLRDAAWMVYYEPDVSDIKAENAKLRELVQNLRKVTPADVVGVVIGANTDHPSYYKFDKAFRELGIEVDS